MVHPKQLEKQFGGEAENVTTYWPPSPLSSEYGIDESKLAPETEEEYFRSKY